LISLEDKKRGIALITEAINAGASTKKSCETIGISKSAFIRWSISCKADNRHGPLSEPKNKYSIEEKRRIIDVCTSKEFCDTPPCQIVPSLADQGLFVGSESTFYKVLHEFEMQKKRSNKSSHKRKKPKELVATEPNQVWSWDITYLPAEIRGKFYYLYLIMDIFSRKIVGSKVYEKECMSYSAELIEMTCIVEDVKKDHLTLHSDNGGPMKGSTMLAKLQDL
jgi:transposase